MTAEIPVTEPVKALLREEPMHDKIATSRYTVTGQMTDVERHAKYYRPLFLSRLINEPRVQQFFQKEGTALKLDAACRALKHALDNGDQKTIELAESLFPELERTCPKRVRSRALQVVRELVGAPVGWVAGELLTFLFALPYANAHGRPFVYSAGYNLSQPRYAVLPDPTLPQAERRRRLKEIQAEETRAQRAERGRMPNQATIAAQAEQDVRWYCQYKFNNLKITALAKASLDSLPYEPVPGTTRRHQVQVAIDRAADWLGLPGRQLKWKPHAKNNRTIKK